MDRLKSYKNKTFVQNMITIGMVVVCYAVIQALIATGNINSLMKGILVPICTYVILAVSLNLTVGILGELSLGHAGFMCVGAFSGAFFTNLMADAIPNTMVRFVFAILIGAAVAALFGFLIGIPVLRLKGDYLAIVTLAFGEIIKNIINSMFVGVDGAGIHVSMKDTSSLGLAADGKIIINMKPEKDINGNDVYVLKTSSIDNPTNPVKPNKQDNSSTSKKDKKATNTGDPTDLWYWLLLISSLITAGGIIRIKQAYR